jgi:biotin operon repressor
VSNARFCIIPARAIGDQRLNRTDIMVLNCLGLFGDKHGWCFPSTAKIAETIQCHRTSVSKSISALVECGYVEVRARYRNDGGQTSNEYRILFDAPQSGELPPIDVQEAIDTIDSTPCSENATPPYGETAIPPMAADAYPPVAHTPYHNNEPTLTPQVKKEISPKNVKSDYPGEFDELWDAWPKERRCEKPEAYRAWRRACEKIAPADLMQCVHRYLATKEPKEGFAPYPAKWLKRERWIEFPAPEAESKITVGELGRNTKERHFLTELHNRLRSKYGDAIYRSWFMPSLRAVDVCEDEISFSVPTRFMAEWITAHYGSDIDGFTRQIWPHVAAVNITPASANAH